MIKFNEQQSKQIIKEITRVSWAADVSKRPNREVLKFIQLECKGGDLTIIATNGRILSYGQISDLDCPDFTAYVSAKMWRKWTPKNIILNLEDMFIYDGVTPDLKLFSVTQLEEQYGRYPSVTHIINQPTREIITLANTTLKALRTAVKDYDWERNETKIVTFNTVSNITVGIEPDALNVNYDYLWALIKKAPKNALITIQFGDGMDYRLRPAKISVDGVYWGTISPLKVSGQ